MWSTPFLPAGSDIGRPPPKALRTSRDHVGIAIAFAGVTPCRLEEPALRALSGRRSAAGFEATRWFS